MTRDEFGQWLDRHSAMFPRVAETFSKLGTPELARNVRNAWRDALTWTKLDEANAASDAMLSGEIKRPYFEDTVAAVCGYVRQLRGERRHNSPRFADGQRTFACPHCEDTGLVLVWSDSATKAARDGQRFDPRHGPSAAIACVCTEGDQKAKGIARHHSQSAPRFRPGTDVLFVSARGTRPQASDVEDWRHFCEQVATSKPAGFHEEFAAFS